MNDSFQAKLERIAREQGADLFGVADLTSAIEFICRQGGEPLKGFPKAISIGIRLTDAVVNELHRHDDPETILPYEKEYFSVNSRLDNVAAQLARTIREENYLAYPILASQTIDSDRLTGLISHKLVANLAGLGWIGKSCLLITREYGPRVRLTSVLTDAPLRTGLRIGTDCDKCDACVRTCPARALTGATFNPSEPREVRFRAHLCNSYMKKREGRVGQEGLCGFCVYVCPYGRTNIRNILR